MRTIKDIYREDQYNVRKWEKHYTDKEFYEINRNLRNDLDSILKSRNNFSAREIWMAGMVYHHGFTLSASRRALRLAKEAYERGYKPAKTLIAQATDRLLQLQGKPQKFGTQAVQLKSGKWKMYKIDGSVTDEERREHGLPNLKTLVSYLNT